LTLEGFKQVPQITRVRDDEGAHIRAFPRAPLARGRPTCRVREPARAASRGDPTEGELLHPRSLANGAEPHLANPRKCFNGRVSGPRAYPYRTGHGRPLEPPASSSTRNPQSAPRSMGVVETSPSVPRRDGEGAFITRRKARPDRLERAQARGLDARLHLLGCTERKSCQSCTCDRGRLEHCRCRLKQTPHTLVKTRENPCRSTHSPAGLRGLDPRVR
jgi:hypothetical protein